MHTRGPQVLDRWAARCFPCYQWAEAIMPFCFAGRRPHKRGSEGCPHLGRCCVPLHGRDVIQVCRATQALGKPCTIWTCASTGTSAWLPWACGHVDLGNGAELQATAAR